MLLLPAGRVVEVDVNTALARVSAPFWILPLPGVCNVPGARVPSWVLTEHKVSRPPRAFPPLLVFAVAVSVTASHSFGVEGLDCSTVVVGPFVTANGSAVDPEAAKLESPAYCAMTECEPAGTAKSP